jgi:hypothetical protein
MMAGNIEPQSLPRGLPQQAAELAVFDVSDEAGMTHRTFRAMMAARSVTNGKKLRCNGFDDAPPHLPGVRRLW